MIDQFLRPSENFSQQWTTVDSRGGWLIILSNSLTYLDKLQYSTTWP
jgi:hypothetical protein